MRLAADALYASNIAEGISSGAINPDIILGYVFRGSGHVWSSSDWNIPQFDGKTKGTISTYAGYAADVWDAETGDGQPSDITTFRSTCTNAGQKYCTVYAGKYQWLPEILSIIASEQLPNILIWDSDATGVPHLNNGSTATQYAVDSQLHAGYDLSLAVDSPHWLGIDTAPPDPPPAHLEDFENMLSVPRADGSIDIYGVLPTDISGNRGGRHVWMQNGVVKYNDVLPGSWAEFFYATTADGTNQVNVFGWAWQANNGGGVYADSWTVSKGWQGPFQQLP